MNIQKYLDTYPNISDDGVYIHHSAQIIGDVTINKHSSIWCNAVVRGDVNSIYIGKYTNIQDLSMVHVSHKNEKKPTGSPTIIGDYVTVGHCVIIHGCEIKDRCLIGMGSIIMDDAVINNDVMIGAGSLVPPNKVLESYMLYIGRPVVAVRKLTDAEIEYLTYSAQHYYRVKENYLNSGKSKGNSEN
jgi:carbonic anhydrase/acetyltransferase-like protein (isoleucine patch superfamily)